MPRKDKVIHISNLPSTFKGNITRNGRFIQNGIPPLGGAYDKVAKSTGLIRLGNEFLYNGVNNLVSKDNREKLMNNTAGRLINYVKDFNKESFPSDDELGPTFPFNIIQTPRSNGKNLPQKQYAVGGKIPNVVAGGIAQPLGNNFFYMNGRKHSQGGIDIGPSDKTGIEVEDGEVVETNGNELKVYSAQPIINGVSPAKLVMGGANPNKVFKAQEDFKDRNRINDDGTKYKEGGKIYQAPNEYKRQIAESGSIIIGGYPTIAGNRNYKFIKGLTKASRIGRTATNFINLGRQKIYDLANKIDNTWINQGTSKLVWKAWDFSFSLRASLNNYVYNSVEAGGSDCNPTSVYSFGALNNRPLMGVANNIQSKNDDTLLSDYFVQNASFMKCDNITLGYSFKKLFGAPIGGRVYAAVQNVFTITKYKGLDPEVEKGLDNNIYPRPLTTLIGLSLNF